MRIRVRPSRRKTTIVLSLASMIDVVFLLLIYALVTMVIAIPEDKLSSALYSETAPAAGPRSDFEPQIVDVELVDGSPAYKLGSRVFRDRETLTEALKPLDKETGLYIKIADGVTVEWAVGAFQAGEDAGFTNRTYVLPK